MVTDLVVFGTFICTGASNDGRQVWCWCWCWQQTSLRPDVRRCRSQHLIDGLHPTNQGRSDHDLDHLPFLSTRGSIQFLSRFHRPLATLLHRISHSVQLLGPAGYTRRGGRLSNHDDYTLHPSINVTLWDVIVERFSSSHYPSRGLRAGDAATGRHPV